MIPAVDVEPWFVSPLPSCPLPDEAELSEDEGFGIFRDAWPFGQVSRSDASTMGRIERCIIDWLDVAAESPEDFEDLATAIEHADVAGLREPLRAYALAQGVRSLVPDDDDPSPLSGLEAGVAGLTYVLSSCGCLTAASCRWHISARPWSNCPVVLFAAPDETVRWIVDPVADTGCGLDLEETRQLLRMFAPSIRNMHSLASGLVEAQVAGP